jgi:hypothetical protein
LSLPDNEIVAEVERQVALYHETGVIEEAFMQKQHLDQ